MELTNDLIHPKIALTKNMELMSGTHILYLYSDRKKYWENMLSFIMTGLELEHEVILLESPDLFPKIKQELLGNGFSKEQIESIVFTDHQLYYKTCQSIGTEAILKELKGSLQPYIEKNLAIRIWSVVFRHEESCCEKDLPIYEQKANEILSQLRSFTVCAYDDSETSAGLAIDLMKGHSYVMTDDELTASLYYKNRQGTPSLSLEERLHEKVSHYKYLIEEMPDAVFVVSDHQVVYGNQTAAQLLECNKADLLAMTAWNLFSTEYHELLEIGIEKLKRNEKLPPVEMKMISYSGRVIDVEVSAFPFSRNMETDFTAILIIRSIYERKAHQQLTIKTEKLSLAGQLAASIAHEVRNPLTSIKGFLKLAREDMMHDAYYTIIDEEIDRIETIASELLVLGKPMSVEIEVCDAGKMLRDVCILLQSQAVMRKILIEFNGEPNCLIRCNPGQMKQVFINIIKNATEAMENGGTIRASARLNGDMVQIVIEDEGKGMPETVLKKLGEPFYTTKEDGTGLGLMVCFNIVEQYGGTIRVESKVDKGTVFTIELPFAFN
ncbi:ATP-binding protein [Domibacillus indicus]|uniref:ATP-binding protein n=1 Tax=Domibacillus indicus TaxID=1437523 RepID=UPI00069904E4|nr:ATP-binding protein [Domibacillus indicus]